MGMRINMRTMCIWPWVKDFLGYNFFMAQKWVSEHRTYITCSVNSGTLDPKLLNLDPEVGKNMDKIWKNDIGPKITISVAHCFADFGVAPFWKIRRNKTSAAWWEKPTLWKMMDFVRLDHHPNLLGKIKNSMVPNKPHSMVPVTTNQSEHGWPSDRARDFQPDDSNDHPQTHDGSMVLVYMLT